jgi:hypothetical protein
MLDYHQVIIEVFIIDSVIGTMRYWWGTNDVLISEALILY